MQKRPHEEAARGQPSANPGERPQRKSTLPILDFQPAELWENRFLLFKPPSLWNFGMAALAD